MSDEAARVQNWLFLGTCKFNFSVSRERDTDSDRNRGIESGTNGEASTTYRQRQPILIVSVLFESQKDCSQPNPGPGIRQMLRRKNLICGTQYSLWYANH